MIDQKKILLVEDNDEFRKSLKWILESEGFLVFEAENAEHAKNVLNLEQMDVVISDHQMAGINGPQLFSWILESKIDVYFILMTGLGDMTKIKQARDLGVHGFISKPFSKEEVIGSIQSVLQRKVNHEPLKIV